MRITAQTLGLQGQKQITWLISKMTDLPANWHGMAPIGTQCGHDLVTSLICKSAVKATKTLKHLSYEYPSFCAKQEPPISILEC
jgi:hypothetical protein